MQIKVEDLLRHSVVISIDNEIYNRFKCIFEQQELTPIPKLYQGMEVYGIGAYWEPRHQIQDNSIAQCLYSHLSIIKMAKFLDWPYVCIFEDDAYPCRNCRQHLEELLNDVPDDANCLILGTYHLKTTSYSKSDKISYCNEVWGSHAYIMFKKGYDDYIEFTQRYNSIADINLQMMSNVYASNLNLFIQYNDKPSIIHQYNGYLSYDYDKAKILDQFPKIEEYDIDNITKKSTVAIMCYFISENYNNSLNIMEWFYNLKFHYLIDCDRKFIIYTDNKNVKTYLDDELIEWHFIDEDKTKDHIKNLMYKFHYISDYLNSCSYKDYIDYIAFIQSNGRCLTDIRLIDIIQNNDDVYDIAFTIHPSFSCKSADFVSLNTSNENTSISIKNIDYSNFKYIAARFFICRINAIQKICNQIISLINLDEQHNAIPAWHDESYLNYVINVYGYDSQYKIKYLDGNEYASCFYSNCHANRKVQFIQKKKYKKTSVFALNIDDVFKNSFVISLDENRLKSFYERLMDNDIQILPKKHAGVIFKNSSSDYWKKKLTTLDYLTFKAFGIASAHREIIEIARHLDLPYVMIFEDDALPIHHLKNYMQLLLNSIPENADMIFLGHCSCQDINIDFDNSSWEFLKMSKNPGTFVGAQSYIIFKKAYDKYLEVFNNIEFISDRIPFFLENSYLANVNMFVQLSNDNTIILSDPNKSYQNLEKCYL